MIIYDACDQENFGRREQHLEQHYNDVLQTLSQRYGERSAGLEEEKKGKLEALYKQLLACGQAMDASKELIEASQEIYRTEDKRLFLKVLKLRIFGQILKSTDYILWGEYKVKI